MALVRALGALNEDPLELQLDGSSELLLDVSSEVELSISVAQARGWGFAFGFGLGHTFAVGLGFDSVDLDAASFASLSSESESVCTELAVSVAVSELSSVDPAFDEESLGSSTYDDMRSTIMPRIVLAAREGCTRRSSSNCTLWTNSASSSTA